LVVGPRVVLRAHHPFDPLGYRIALVFVIGLGINPPIFANAGRLTAFKIPPLGRFLIG